ncbi:hypothetical protein QYF36_004564 [Acer negundo]|nr:hypothetical protein QYF36_004564 [Acer negundo]
MQNGANRFFAISSRTLENSNFGSNFVLLLSNTGLLAVLIRVPDDRSGWDWPEALSATVGLVNSSVSTPNMPSNSDLAKLVGSSRGLIKSGQHLDNIVFPKNARTGQSLVIDALHDKEQRYGQDSSNYLLKDLINLFINNTF